MAVTPVIEVPMSDYLTNTQHDSLQYLYVKNWQRWQTYRHDRGLPPWIKVHRRLMRNPNWVALTDAQKGQLVCIWMLAADQNGRVPSCPKLIKRLCCLETEPDLTMLISQGFLDAKMTPRRVSTRRQLVTPKAEAKAKAKAKAKADIDSASPPAQPGEKKRKPRKEGVALPTDWIPTEDHYALGERLGMGREAVISAAQDMRFWAEANEHRQVARKSNWNATFSGWLKRNTNNSFAPNGSNGDGQGRPRPLQNDSLSASRAAKKLIEKAERGEFSFGPRPTLYPTESPDDLLMLPKGRNPRP